MQTWETVSATLAASRNKDRAKVTHNTYLERRADDAIALRLHNTDVLTFHPDHVVFNTGGWFTVTTKNRMDYSGHRVYSRRGTWYVHTFDSADWENDIRYFDGIAFDYQGKCVNAELAPVDNSRVIAKTKREIAAYSKLAVSKLAEGLPMPGAGDCWYCVMRTDDGTPLGDASANHEHLTSHIEEGYIVPSLLWNAVAECGYRFPEVILGAHEASPGTYALGGIIEGDYPRPRAMDDSVKRAVTKYLKRRLLPNEEGAKPVGTPAHVGGYAGRS